LIPEIVIRGFVNATFVTILVGGVWQARGLRFELSAPSCLDTPCTCRREWSWMQSPNSAGAAPLPPWTRSSQAPLQQTQTKFKTI